MTERKYTGTSEFITFSTMDFFDRFVRQANDKRLLKSPLPTPLSKNNILLSSLQLLHACKIEKRDLVIEDDQYGGTIMITEKGLKKIELYFASIQQEKAAIIIQKVWRGYRARAQNTEYLYYEKYIQNLSRMYYEIMNEKRASSNANPTSQEVLFMKKLNDPETYRVCHEYLLLLVEVENVSCKLMIDY
jgi:hypothetical protein